MAQLAAPVTVVTTADGEGRRWGFTASAVTSVSLDPPRILVGITHGSSCHQPLLEAGQFVVNVLAGRHDTLAMRFAARGTDRFAGGEFEDWPGTRLPYLPDAAVLLRCAVRDIVPVGDHDLLLAEPLEAHTGGSSGALVWYQRSFHVPVQTAHLGEAAAGAA
ncbi:NADH:riboflavin 5'-phosphate oxidoreductase [Streptomyces monashensis]|uniref:NADH:riboflavin 5'-phosphate oxidoreductase n=2 Tax=Streptomyces monashensis TaxID=1678012 RepID=A0A1S2QIS5_9ACTN|nr:NADH:riboflavin 5'-phosphate oxidoreductase [Streptomyces monashensis]